MPLGPGGFERKNNHAVDLHASPHARRIAEQAAAPNARYYGHEDPIVGMPCAQAMGGHPRVRSPLLGLSTILETDVVRIVPARMHDGRSVKCAHSGENMAAHIYTVHTVPTRVVDSLSDALRATSVAQ